jgi:hypothetical protein
MHSVIAGPAAKVVNGTRARQMPVSAARVSLPCRLRMAASSAAFAAATVAMLANVRERGDSYRGLVSLASRWTV